MAAQDEGQLIRGIHDEGDNVFEVFDNGESVFQTGGLPRLVHFSVDPTQGLVSDTIQTLSVQVETGGTLTGGSLTEYISGQSPNVLESDYRQLITPPGASVQYLTPFPRRDVHFALVLSNSNGTVARTLDWFYGSAPVITHWGWSQYRQGGIGRLPDSVLISWTVTGIPAPTLTVMPTIHYRLPSLSGSYRLTRDGNRSAEFNEILTLGAENRFGSVAAQLVIPWPREQG